MSHRPTAVFLLFGLAGCGSSARTKAPDIPALYRDAALDEIRNPVVVIHGVLGARLEQRSTGKAVWGAFTGDCVDPATADGARAIALPLSIPASAEDFDPDVEDVVATGPLDHLELSVLYSVVSVDVYAAIIRALGIGGYRDRVAGDQLSPRYADDHYTCFSFFYDWRRDNVANAIQLGRFLTAARAEVERVADGRITALRAQDDAGARARADELQAWIDRGVRFDVVAHSMGGLIARYYLRYGAQDLPRTGGMPEITWAGSADIDRLVLVGTPNLGAMESLQQLQEGYQASFLLPYFGPAILGTMPSIYQLLPRPRHGLVVDEGGAPVDLDFLDPEVWIRNRWGILGPDAELESLLPGVADPIERRRIAEDYVTWALRRARRFHHALDAFPATPPPRTEISLFAGDVEPTLERARITRDTARTVVPTFGGADLRGAGDGTVTRGSAIGDERQGDPVRRRLRTPVPWSRVTFLADDHIGLTSNPTFVDNLLFQLMEAPLR